MGQDGQVRTEFTKSQKRRLKKERQKERKAAGLAPGAVLPQATKLETKLAAPRRTYTATLLAALSSLSRQMASAAREHSAHTVHTRARAPASRCC